MSIRTKSGLAFLNSSDASGALAAWPTTVWPSRSSWLLRPRPTSVSSSTMRIRLPADVPPPPLSLYISVRLAALLVMMAPILRLYVLRPFLFVARDREFYTGDRSAFGRVTDREFAAQLA